MMLKGIEKQYLQERGSEKQNMKKKKIEFVQAIGLTIIFMLIALAIYWTIDIRFNGCRKMVDLGIYKSTYICLIDRNKQEVFMKNKKKEITKTFISFKSKRQLPLIMIIKTYYKTKADRKADKECWGEVLFNSDNLLWTIKKLFRKITRGKKW